MTHRIIFSNDQLWIRRTGEGQATCLLDRGLSAGDSLCSETLGCDAGQTIEVVDAPPDTVASGIERIGLRSFFDWASSGEYALAARGFSLLHWRRTHRFCGRCGRAMARHSIERAMVCDVCKDLVFPRTNPVVIVRVTRGHEVLLAHRAGGVVPFYSVLAGFVEAAETLEQAVHREIAEEVGLRVNNLRYFSSQPWPFPNNLMIAFTAEYESGEICVDGHEIAEAGWFTRAALPPIPPPISIARRMIDDFLGR